ncbi:hypothetical protein LX69_02343 [Breznakibacter xylanolyticus]|uniref:Uncharacterized protein n=1 Tax=Breznakibacter xylanolyticus TaxID=990 RepID=A0A2W7PY82_9BACT|nr:hypothetical protein [Breznakibacter xylanolyticus]MBN2743290.1 hypothetical protein [Marinilabiliaceae bacterium]PZX14519.1 hypothetical protein LX69_02343 [Breznakibacter xylanolyticus]
MKKLFLSLSAILSMATSLLAQEHIPTPQDYQNFKSTRTLVVMDINPMSDFNFKIKEVMANVWKLTEFEFIDQKEFESKRRDPSYSFLLTTTATFDADKTKARYTFLSLLMGKDVANVSNMPDLCSIPLSYKRVEDDSYYYKMDAFIRFIQDHVTLMTDNPKLIKANPLTYYNKNAGDLKNKTLYVVKEELSPDINTIAKIKKVYPNEVKIVSRDEIMEVIDSKDPNAVFFHKVGPEGTQYKARCYKIVIGAGDSKLYYFDWHMIDANKKRDWLLESDLKSMAK